MNDQLWLSIHQRIDEHFAYVRERLDEQRIALHRIESALTARLNAHEDYHRGHEHRWGLLALARRHPFRLAALTMLAAWTLLATDAGSLVSLAQFAQKLFEAVLK